jgi:glycosyltransferase involved in cell wall biosynthesis
MNINKATPLISVVTPSYNQGRYIEDTIQSVLNQEYPNIEYIVVDGGSTDNTIEILKKYEDKLKWISEKDEGQTDAISKGFNMAKGDILGWLNSDDAYLPDAVNAVVKHFHDCPGTGMVYGKSHLTDETGNIISNYPTEPFDYKRLARFNFIAQPSVFFRKETYMAAGGVDRNLHYIMDYDLWLRIAKKYRIDFLPHFISNFRLHAGSKTISDKHALESQEECLKAVTKYYGWVPPNRVYGYYYYYLKSKLPHHLKNINFLISLLSLLISSVEYVRLNKGIKLNDIKMLNPDNFRKMLKGWEFKDLLKKTSSKK